VDAVYPDNKVPSKWNKYLEINRAYFTA
jgi:hypothetical protein